MKPNAASVNEIRAEHNFDYTKAVRGKYFRRILKEGANVAVLAARRALARPARTRAKATRTG